MTRLAIVLFVLAGIVAALPYAVHPLPIESIPLAEESSASIQSSLAELSTRLERVLEEHDVGASEEYIEIALDRCIADAAQAHALLQKRTIQYPNHLLIALLICLLGMGVRLRLASACAKGQA